MTRAPELPLTTVKTAVSKLDDLGSEACFLHQAVFARPAPADLQRQYAAALEHAPLANVPACDLTPLFERGIDIEALELVLRRQSPVNSLTQRCHVLCYLAEARPEYYHCFVNESPRQLVGWSFLLWHVLRSMYLLMKGRWLLWRYDIR